MAQIIDSAEGGAAGVRPAGQPMGCFAVRRQPRHHRGRGLEAAVHADATFMMAEDVHHNFRGDGAVILGQETRAPRLSRGRVRVHRGGAETGGEIHQSAVNGKAGQTRMAGQVPAAEVVSAANGQPV